MIEYLNTQITIGTDGGVNFGYDSLEPYGNITDATFGQSTVTRIINSVDGVWQLYLTDNQYAGTLPDRLTLTVNRNTKIVVKRTSNVVWQSSDRDTTLVGLGDGTTAQISVHVDAINIVMIDLDLTRNGGRVFRLASSAHDVQWNGYTYQAVGDLLDVEGLDETADLTSIGTTVGLNGVDPAYRAEIDSNAFLRAPIDIMIGTLPEGGDQVLDSQYWHRGTCDTPNTVIDYSSDPATMRIEVSTQSIFGNLDKVPDLCRTSQGSHSSRHPGDLFFSKVASISQEEVWRT